MNLEDTSIKCSQIYTVGDFNPILQNKYQVDAQTWMVVNSKGRMLKASLTPTSGLLLQKIGDHNQRKSISLLKQE